MYETELLHGGESRVRTERVIERIEVLKPVYTTLPDVKIGICGLTAGAGATFAAIALAGTVARMGISVSITEMGEKILEEMVGEVSQKLCHKDAAVKLYDFSGGAEISDEQLKRMDKLLVLIDPLPSKIVKGFERAQTLFAKYDCMYILGKAHKEVRRREIKKIFGCKGLYEIPFIEPEYIYVAEQKSILFSDVCFVKEQMEAPIQKILRHVLPSEVLKLVEHVIQ